MAKGKIIFFLAIVRPAPLMREENDG